MAISPPSSRRLLCPSLMAGTLALVAAGLPRGARADGAAAGLTSFLQSRVELSHFADKQVTQLAPGVLRLELGSGSTLSAYALEPAPSQWSVLLESRVALADLTSTDLVGDATISRAFLLVTGADAPLPVSALPPGPLRDAVQRAFRRGFQLRAGANLFVEIVAGRTGALGALRRAGLLPETPLWLVGTVGPGVVHRVLGAAGAGPKAASTELSMSLTLFVGPLVPPPFKGMRAPLLTFGPARFIIEKTGDALTLSGEQRGSTINLPGRRFSLPSTSISFRSDGAGKVLTVEGRSAEVWKSAFGLPGVSLDGVRVAGSITVATTPPGNDDSAKRPVPGFALGLFATVGLAGKRFEGAVSARSKGGQLEQFELSIENQIDLGFTGVPGAAEVTLSAFMLGFDTVRNSGYLAGAMKWRGLEGGAVLAGGRAQSLLFLEVQGLDLGALLAASGPLSALPRLNAVLALGKSPALAATALPGPITELLEHSLGTAANGMSLPAVDGIALFTQLDASAVGAHALGIKGPLVLMGAIELARQTVELRASLPSVPAIPGLPAGFAVRAPAFAFALTRQGGQPVVEAGLELGLQVPVGDQRLDLVGKMALGTAGKFSFTGTMATDWREPLGMAGLTLRAPVVASVGLNADASVDLGFQGGARLGSLDYDPIAMCVNLQAAVPAPVPKKFAVALAGPSFGPMAQIELMQALTLSAAQGPLKNAIPDPATKVVLDKAAGGLTALTAAAKLLPLPLLAFNDVKVSLATPGVSCSGLPAIAGMGIKLAGKAVFMQQTGPGGAPIPGSGITLGAIDSYLSLEQGLKIDARIEPFSLLGLVSLNNARIDVLVPMPSLAGPQVAPHFVVEGDARLLFASARLRVVLDASRASFELSTQLADLIKTEVVATTVGPSLAQVSDFQLALKAETGMRDALIRKLAAAMEANARVRSAAARKLASDHQREVAATKAAFAVLDRGVGASFRKAQADLRAADAKFDKTQSDLARAKADCKRKTGPFGFVCGAVDVAKVSVEVARKGRDATALLLKGIEKSSEFSALLAKGSLLATLEVKTRTLELGLAGWAVLDGVIGSIGRGIASSLLTVEQLSFKGSLKQASGTLAVKLNVAGTRLNASFTINLGATGKLDLGGLAKQVVDEFERQAQIAGSAVRRAVGK